MRIDLLWLSQQFPDLYNIAPLGRGGFKEVFSAQHQVNGDVVLKIIHPHQGVESIRREILAVQQVGSSRVPTIFEIGQMPSQIGSLFWMREQRIIGQTVRDLLGAGPFNRADIYKLALHSLEALSGAEHVHIVHRDVKPDNIIRDTHGDFWLIDFGIARHLQLDSQTATNDIFGKFTAGYGPTEQWKNIKSEIDARADLFALGVTLYECSTGTNPFRHGARDSLEMLNRVETLRLPLLPASPLSGYEFSYLVEAMIQKRRDHRPQSIREALTWINEICAIEGVV